MAILPEKIKGFVAYFNQEKKQGYLHFLDGTHQEVFFKSNNQIFTKGQKVIFQIKESRQGWEGVNLVKI